MGALTRMMGSLTAVNATEVLNTSISTLGMKTSAKAMKVLGDSGAKSATTILGTVRHLDGRKMSQDAKRAVTQKMAAITAEAEILEELSPIVADASKAWEKGVKAKIKALQVVATASQNVAVLNAEAQSGMLVDHITSGNKITAAQERSRAWAGV